MSLSPEKFEEWLEINSFSERFLNVIEANLKVVTLESVRGLYALLTPRWVSVGERLPEEYESKKVVRSFNWTRTEDDAYYCTERGGWVLIHSDILIESVTHWLDCYIPPLPEVDSAEEVK